MRTNPAHDLRDHSGWRWLAPFAAVFFAVIAVMLVMLLYPHVR